MVILVDNGHGAETPGKRSPNGKLLEYAYTREIARRLVAALNLGGYPAVRLVEESTDVPLGERVTRANAYCDKYGVGNCLLVSIHCNACPPDDGKWHAARGWSIYTSKGTTKADRLAQCIAESAKAALIGGGKYESTFTDEDRKKGVKPVREDVSDGDSDFEENFAILRRTRCAAVLTENMFQDNKADVDFLLSDEGKNTLVQIHLNGIIHYILSSTK